MIRIEKITKIILIIIVLTLICVGCGEKNREEEYIIDTSYEGLFFPPLTSQEIVLGLQFYNNNKILLVGNSKGEIVQCTEGNSSKSILLEKVDTELISGLCKWWIDENGYFFVAKNEDLTVMDKIGGLVCKVKFEGNIEDVCRMSTSETVVEIYNQDNNQSSLQILDILTGKITKSILLEMGTVAIATGIKQNLLVMDTDGVYGYNIEDESKNWYMKWKGTSYNIDDKNIEDIQYSSDQRIFLLMTALSGESKILETIQKSDIESVEKNILTYETTSASVGLKEAIVQFNKENKKYFVKLIECPKDTDVAIYKEKSRIEIATGHGPDIVNGVMIDNIDDLLNKGVFEDLTNYIEKANLKEEKFIPYTLKNWSRENKIYGIGISFIMSAFYVQKDILTPVDKWNLDSVMEAVEQGGDKVIFNEYYDSAGLLEYCLMLSDDLHGVINWDANTCDFQSESWKKLFEFTNKYGYRQEKKGYKEVAKIAYWTGFSYYSCYDNVMDQNSMQATGWPSDDENNILLQMDILGMNSKSQNKQGVWEFISFLLRDDIQEKMCEKPNSCNFPVNLSAFDEVGKKLCTSPTQISINSFGVEGETEGITKNQVEEIKMFLSHAKPSAYNTKTIIKIIEEEVAAYYAGTKTMDEVNGILQNRVQLYLDEKCD